LSAVDEAETIRHEFVHRWLTPLGSGRVTTARQNLSAWFYENSSLMRVLEEAAAETYGTRSLLRGAAFPFTHGYVRASAHGSYWGDLILVAGAGGTVYAVKKAADQ
jgi:hypothetical protein